MSDRPEVQTVSWPLRWSTSPPCLELRRGARAAPLPNSMAWAEPSAPQHGVIGDPRVRPDPLLGYASSLPIDEFRSWSGSLTGSPARSFLPSSALQGVASEVDEIGAVPGIWFRPLRGYCLRTTVTALGDSGRLSTSTAAATSDITAHVLPVHGSLGAGHGLLCVRRGLSAGARVPVSGPRSTTSSASSSI